MWKECVVIGLLEDANYYTNTLPGNSLDNLKACLESLPKETFQRSGERDPGPSSLSRSSRTVWH